MIDRPLYLEQLAVAMRRSPVTALLGPRQCGKTTLARLFGAARQVAYFDLESQPDLRRLQNPELMLGAMQGMVILDEIQRLPHLFSVLRVLVDRPENQARFLILGSASPDVVKNVSETLAGRVEFIELAGFDLQEAGIVAAETLWLRGGFPRSFLAASDEDSFAWREGFIRTFPRAGHSPARHCHSCHRHATFLDHAGPLSWANLECFGTGPLYGALR
jgi:predicted AAA+ superfamily ATPase